MAEKTDSQIEAAAAERMKVLGGEPLADEVIPDNEPVPADDLEEVDENEPDKDDSTPEDDEGNVEDDDDSTPEDDDDEPVDKDDDEVDKDDDAHKANDQKDKPQLSDAYYRAAINSGMEEKEIVEFYATNPDLAEKTFAKLYDNMNSLTNEYAALGKHKKEQAAGGDKVQNTDSDDKSSFEKIDLAKLKEEFPEDSLVDVIGKMQDQMEGMSNELKSRPVNTNTDNSALENEKVKRIAGQIESFFNSEDTQRFAVMYGTVNKPDTDWLGLLPSEQVNRVAVCERAEEIVTGAEVLGRELEFSEALERAHLEISKPMQDQIIRDDIMAKVVKRSKGITLKPSSKSSVENTDEKPTGEKDVIANADARLRKVFPRS
ncbi:MAG: hypothetical protein FVQ80_11075 [Planctomycetes bacterium]|nr:hypothetical protein [Planctomycetota bacterium]